AVLEALPLLDWWPDVLHGNDWQTGLVPVYLREFYRKPPAPHRARYDQVRTLFTLHNVAYQGLFWHLDQPLPGLPWDLFNPDHLDGKARCKAALQADFGLNQDPRTPLLGIVSRLAAQKGFDLLERVAAPILAEERVQLVVLGDGEQRYQQALNRVRQLFPRQ